MSKKSLVLRPFVTAGEPIVRNDGTAEVVPMQLFRLRDGGVCLRIGNSTYFFTAEGRFDGSEHKADEMSDQEVRKLVDLLEKSKANIGKAPGEPYYPPGTDGGKSEAEGVAYHQSNKGARSAAPSRKEPN
jgi:hypothetical protein